jgi:lysine-specific demethylase 8
MVDSVEVERVAPEDPRTLAERLERGAVPLVIAGGASSWPAVERWTPEYLVRLLGPIELPYKLSSGNAHPDFRAQGLGRMFARGRGALPDFFRSITTGPLEERARCLFTGDERFLLRRRSGQTSVDPELSPLLGDVSTPPFFSEARLHTVWAWFSGVGVRTWLHYDNNGCHNLNAQVAGRKRCVLFPPEELARMHVFPLGGDNPAYNCSRIDVEQPKSDVAADLAAARAWHAELGAGDLLFIPAWWFHTFLHTGEFNANVNFWWKPERPSWNVVAARQALVDAAQAAALDTKDAVVAQALGALDAAARRRT